MSHAYVSASVDEQIWMKGVDEKYRCGAKYMPQAGVRIDETSSDSKDCRKALLQQVGGTVLLTVKPSELDQVYDKDAARKATNCT